MFIVHMFLIFHIYVIDFEAKSQNFCWRNNKKSKNLIDWVHSHILYTLTYIRKANTFIDFQFKIYEMKKKWWTISRKL